MDIYSVVLISRKHQNGKYIFDETFLDKEKIIEILYESQPKLKRIVKEVEEEIDVFLKETDKITCTKFENWCKKIFLPKIKFFNKNYWIIRGWTEKEAKEKVSEIQRKNANKELENLLKEGYTEEEAKKRRSKARSERIKTFKNTLTEEERIAFNRNNSCWSKEFWIRKGYTEEEAKIKISEYQKNNTSKLNEKRKSNPELYSDCLTNQLGYWTSRDYSETEAKQKVRERQATFSLQKCIEKNGTEEGTKIWKERQNKWQKTLNSKPKEEIERINKDKGKNARGVIFTNLEKYKSVPGILYYIRFWNEEIEFWKIGITSQKKVEKRFWDNKFSSKYNLNKEVIFAKSFNSIHDCFIEEQKILKEYEKDRTRINYNGFSTTEAFNNDIFKNEEI